MVSMPDETLLRQGRERKRVHISPKHERLQLTEYIAALQAVLERFAQKPDPGRTILTPRWEDYCSNLNLKSSEREDESTAGHEG